MRSRARLCTAAATVQPLWLALTAAGTVAILSASAHGQSSPTASDAVPPATSHAAPAEIQPGHPPPAYTGSTGSATATGPQLATPAPLPRGADTPGGSARNGIIAPPAVVGDHDINRGAPGGSALGTPLIPPPGAPGGDQHLAPK